MNTCKFPYRKVYKLKATPDYEKINIFIAFNFIDNRLRL